MKNKIKKYLSEIIAASAMFIALVTAITTIIQTIDNKKHNILSVKPHLITSASTSELNNKNEYKFKISLKNSGAGPAYLSKIEYKIDNIDIYSSSDFREKFVKKISGKLKGIDYRYNLLLSEFDHNVLKEGEKKNIILVNIYPKKINLEEKEQLELNKIYDEITAILDKIITKVKYKSLYDVQYEYDSTLKGH